MSAKVILELTREGSVLRGDLECRGRLLTELNIETDSQHELGEVRELLRTARLGCFARQLIARETPSVDVAVVNGEAIEL